MWVVPRPICTSSTEKFTDEPADLSASAAARVEVSAVSRTDKSSIAASPRRRRQSFVKDKTSGSADRMPFFALPLACEGCSYRWRTWTYFLALWRATVSIFVTNRRHITYSCVIHVFWQFVQLFWSLKAIFFVRLPYRKTVNCQLPKKLCNVQ